MNNTERETLFKFKKEVTNEKISYIGNIILDEFIFEHKQFIIESINIHGLTPVETFSLIKEVYIYE